MQNPRSLPASALIETAVRADATPAAPCRLQKATPALLKRLFDVAFGTVALLAILPLLLVLVAAIWLGSPGNPFFVQERLGQYGKPFRMLKLRTMVADAERRRDEVEYLNEAPAPFFKARTDPRMTRLGRFLRAASLDELPQLINVVRGEMSIVGPRPRLPREFADVMDRPEIVRRLVAKPGLAGLWQVRGRSHNTFEQALTLDLFYIDHWSFWFDFKLIIQTLIAVMTTVGAY